nr:electron transfer flavoprotein subunit beta/FixA family protein [Anaerolineae bacterium]
MKVVVILGRVLDPGGIVVHRRLGRIFINREEYLINPADRCALEAALRIKDAAGAEVVVVSGRPEPDDDTLRQGLAAGADRAIYLTSGGFAQADDAAVVRALAAAVERLGGADLVLTGATTLDTGQSQLGPRLAEALGWPQIVGAWRAEVADGRVQAVLQEGAGYVTVEADLPAVVTVLPGALKPRYPDGVRLINVYRAEDAVEKWDVSDLVDEAALQPLLEKRGQDFPPERERGVRLEGLPAEMAQALADALRQRVCR